MEGAKSPGTHFDQSEGQIDGTFSLTCGHREGSSTRK